MKIVDCPKVTVVIATFNVGRTISSAIESLINQTYPNWECLVIDGGSKDNTIDILKLYKQKESRVDFISEPDNGIYDAFNKGWKKAKGEWILYLGADDFLFPSGIAELMKHSDEADVIYGDCELRFGHSSKIRGNLPITCIKYRLPACHQSFVMKRSVIERLGGFRLQYKVYGDFDLIQRAYIAGFNFKETKSVISSFFVGGVSSDNISAEFERCRVMKTNKSMPLLELLIIKNICLKMTLKLWHIFK